MSAPRIALEGSLRSLPRPFIYPYWEGTLASVTVGLQPEGGEALFAVRLEWRMTERGAGFLDWLVPDRRPAPLGSGWFERRAAA